MDYQYHRNDLKKYIELDYVKTALSMLDDVESAMQDYVAGKINTEKYIEQITPYDSFVWNKYKEDVKPKNVYNSSHMKQNSSWREHKWSPIFEIVRQYLQSIWTETEIVLIQNHQVIETFYDSGYVAYKKVDGGIGIKTNKGIIPVVVVEDKAGNICSTTFGGINAQATRLHRSFPNAKYIFITDNQFMVRKDAGVEVADNTNMIVLERGEYRSEEYYPELNAKRFDMVKNELIKILTKMKPSDFLQYEIIHSKTTGRLTDAMNDGIILNW